MNDLTYTTNLTIAWVSMAAFKFADQMFVYFQCQITVCKLAENGCEGISVGVVNNIFIICLASNMRFSTNRRYANGSTIVDNNAIRYSYRNSATN
jgi:hypothetical protein